MLTLRKSDGPCPLLAGFDVLTLWQLGGHVRHLYCRLLWVHAGLMGRGCGWHTLGQLGVGLVDVCM